jgi:hypothetical protein
MSDERVASAKCPQCGSTSLTFQTVCGPADSVSDYMRKKEELVALKHQIAEPEQSLRSSRERLEAEASRQLADIQRKRSEAIEKRGQLQAAVASLTESRDAVLSPIMDRARKSGKAAFEARAKEDPSIYLDDDAESRMVALEFDRLSTQVRSDAGFSRTVRTITAHEAAISSLEGEINEADRQEKDLSRRLDLRLKEERRTFEVAVNEMQSQARVLQETCLRVEMRSQVGVVVCCDCGSLVGAVPSPMPLDEWMRRAEQRDRSQIERMDTMIRALGQLEASIGSLARNVDESSRTLKTELKSLGGDLGKAFVAGQSELARALQGSFSSIQAGMQALVSRMKEVKQRETAEDIRKFFEG